MSPSWHVGNADLTCSLRIKFNWYAFALLLLQFKDHLAKCPLQVVGCYYAFAGCAFRVGRANAPLRTVRGNNNKPLRGISVLLLSDRVVLSRCVLAAITWSGHFSSKQWCSHL